MRTMARSVGESTILALATTASACSASNVDPHSNEGAKVDGTALLQTRDHFSNRGRRKHLHRHHDACNGEISGAPGVGGAIGSAGGPGTGGTPLGAGGETENGGAGAVAGMGAGGSGVPEPPTSVCPAGTVDPALTEATAVFVAPPASGGDDTQDGSRLHPLATLIAAAQLANVSGRDIALAAGTYSGDSVDVRGIHVFGGYEAGTWRRATAILESRIEVTHPLVAGAIPDSMLGTTGKGGGLDGLSVFGDLDGLPLVNDLDVYGNGTSILHDCTLSCERCSEIIRLSNSVDVSECMVLGGRTGIRADGRGSLNVYSQVHVCENDVVGSADYEYGIRVGEESRGPLLVRDNTVTLVDGASTAIRVDAVNAAYAGQQDLYSQIHVVGNKVRGAAAIGISAANPQHIGRNLIELSGVDSVGIHFVNPATLDPMSNFFVALVGNLVTAGASGVRIESPRMIQIRAVNNSIQARRAIWISDVPVQSSFVAVNNVFDATDSNSIEVGGFASGGLSSLTLLSNDLRAPSCLLSQPGATACVSSADAINACTWAACANASANLGVDPGYVSSADLHLGNGSELISAGQDPSPVYDGWLLNTDIDGDARPTAGWDIGADER